MQSAPATIDLPALPPVSKNDTRFWTFLRPVTLTFDLKTGTPLTRAMGNVCADYYYYYYFHFLMP